ncbi:uncharacterized protein F5891DRAFT_1046310 [Suillus fuscotomentosus]|uniref:Uncharacterized protein n=1 Tax=Suillus fuscotomentosus TaxID=1912939 RepID=A0AAD4E1C9_9AGAM|nr:uncharacterized protein F5891DRAFT_1046310 [Suillus fuscotomentosus]KAG1897832.1 hypothetical protein F5891DRAFT_1046310 [Suillus fuscotomentosus]
MSTTDATLSPSVPPVPSRNSESDKTQLLWYDPPRHPFWCLCFKALCLIAISKPSVNHWDDLINGRKKEEWAEHKKMVTDRLGNMNVTAGLVLTTSAVFISTQPPFQPLMPYASHGSYILQVSSFVAALISLMTGTSVLIIYDTCYGNADMKRILKSLKRSRLRLVCSLILMAYPSLALAVSTMALLTAVFVAGFTSDKLFVKILTAVTYLTLVLLAVLAVYVFSAPWFDSINDPDPADSHDRPSSGPKGDSVVSHREIEYSGSRIKPRRKELV